MLPDLHDTLTTLNHLRQKLAGNTITPVTGLKISLAEKQNLVIMSLILVQIVLYF
jgi:hypothetical protein